MRTLYLVGCGKAKRAEPAPACRLYTGNLFRSSLAYALASARCEPRALVRILSAEHGLVRPGEWLAPYDLALTDLSAQDRRSLGAHVAEQLHRTCGIAESDRYVVLAGRAYVDALRRGIAERMEWAPRVEEPMVGLFIGQRLAWLNARLAEVPA